MMEFELSAKSGNTYTVQKKDNIMNNKKASGSQVDVALITTNRAGTLIRLTMTRKPETDSPAACLFQDREYRRFTGDTGYDCSAGRTLLCLCIWISLTGFIQIRQSQIKRADNQTGVVLNRAQQYVWERGNKKTKIQMDIEDVPDTILTAN